MVMGKTIDKEKLLEFLADKVVGYGYDAVYNPEYFFPIIKAYQDVEKQIQSGELDTDERR